MFGPDSRAFWTEIAERLTQRFAVEIARADDVEARGLQGLCDRPGIVGGGLQRAGP